MFLHIGSNVSLLKKEIVAILDIDTSTVSKVTRNFVKNMQDNNQVIVISKELPKSFIITYRDNKRELYVSHISSATLLERFENKVN